MHNKKGQNIVEYTILIAIIISALLVMQFYVKRTYQGRLKEEADQIGQQYSPKHTVSVTQTLTSSASTSCTGGTCFGKTIQPGVTVTQSETQNKVLKQEGVDSFATEE